MHQNQVGNIKPIWNHLNQYIGILPFLSRLSSRQFMYHYKMREIITLWPYTFMRDISKIAFWFWRCFLGLDHWFEICRQCFVNISMIIGRTVKKWSSIDRFTNSSRCLQINQKNFSLIFNANSFAFIADLYIKFSRHEIFTWWLRIPSCGSWENCLKYERSPEIACLPIPRPSATSWLSAAGILGPGATLPTIHGSNPLGATSLPTFSSQEPGASSYKCVQVRTTPATRWLDISSNCSFVLLLVGSTAQIKHITFIVFVT